MFPFEETSNISPDGTTRNGGQGTKMLKKGPWSAAEDALLIDYVKKQGEGNWNAVQRVTGLERCGKSCRLRWANHLRPNLKKGAFTPQEEHLIIELHAKFGNKWARMASQLPGRTDNEIKNFWNTRLKRRQRHGLPMYPPELRQSGGGVHHIPRTSPTFVHHSPSPVLRLRHSQPFFFFPAPSPPPILFSKSGFLATTELPSDQILPSMAETEDLKMDQTNGSGFLEDLLKEAQMIAGITDQFDSTYLHPSSDTRTSEEPGDEAASMNADLSDLLVSFPFPSDWCTRSDYSNGQSGVTDDGCRRNIPPEMQPASSYGSIPASSSCADNASSPSWSFFPSI